MPRHPTRSLGTTSFTSLSESRKNRKRSRRGKAKFEPTIINEVVSYPRIQNITDDPCLSSATACEHVLECRHCIITALPNEPCGANCYHVTNAGLTLDTEIKAAMAVPGFLCGACAEESTNKDIENRPPNASNTITHGASDRDKEASRRGLRKCYIAAKIVSVLCDSDGHPVKGYRKTRDRHPLDTANPPSGWNMFEDIDPNPLTSYHERPSLKVLAPRPPWSRVPHGPRLNHGDAAEHINGASNANLLTQSIRPGTHRPILPAPVRPQPSIPPLQDVGGPFASAARTPIYITPRPARRQDENTPADPNCRTQ